MLPAPLLVVLVDILLSEYRGGYFANLKDGDEIVIHRFSPRLLPIVDAKVPKDSIATCMSSPFVGWPSPSIVPAGSPTAPICQHPQVPSSPYLPGLR